MSIFEGKRNRLADLLFLGGSLSAVAVLTGYQLGTDPNMPPQIQPTPVAATPAPTPEATSTERSTRTGRTSISPSFLRTTAPPPQNDTRHRPAQKHAKSRDFDTVAARHRIPAGRVFGGGEAMTLSRESWTQFSSSSFRTTLSEQVPRPSSTTLLCLRRMKINVQSGGLSNDALLVDGADFDSVQPGFQFPLEGMGPKLSFRAVYLDLIMGEPWSGVA